MANASFASSISSLNLDLIDEDTDNMEEESENAVDENPAAESMETNDENDKSTSLEDILTDALHLDNTTAVVTSDEEEDSPEKKKRRKKRSPKFATEDFDSVYKLGKEVRVAEGLTSDGGERK